MIGRTISHYRILEKLGGGGMGVVYKAEDASLQRTVALKFLPPSLIESQSARNQITSEARAAASLDHPAICAIHEIENADGQTFIVMSYVDGQTVKEKLREGSLAPREVIRLALQIAEGLEEAHRKGVIHRDIKSSNIKVSSRGYAKILDFGLAQIARREQVSEAGCVTGSPPYMSPEQAKGEMLDERTDIWSLGVVMYEMLAGQLPFSGPSHREILRGICSEEPKPIENFCKNVPAELRRIIWKALAKETGQRYQRAAELLRDLRALQRDLEFDLSSQWLTGPRKGPSIAVLPFVNLNSDAEGEYFSDGLTEELIDTLAQLQGLHVVSRTSAFEFKDRTASIQTIGERLRVSAVVDGTVRRSGNKIRITARLINVSDGYQLWSARYDREMQDVFAIQEEIAGYIFSTLKIKLQPQDQGSLAKRPTHNLDAYNLYLRGRYHLNEETESGFQKAAAYFEQALAIDANYALAYSGLSDLYNGIGFYGVLPPCEIWPKARDAAQNALKLDRTLPEAHASLAKVFAYYDWDWRAAEQEFIEAISLNSDNANIRYFYAIFLIQMERLKEARTQMRQALQLDPLAPFINSGMAWVSYYSRQYDQAIEECRKTIDLNPNYFEVYGCLGLSYAEKGQFEEAIDAFHKAKDLSGDSPLAMAFLACTYAIAGNKCEALALLDQLSELSRNRYVSPSYLAVAYIGLGQTDSALEWLQKACQARDSMLLFLRVLQTFDSLRSDPRFVAIEKELRFGDETRTSTISRTASSPSVACP